MTNDEISHSSEFTEPIEAKIFVPVTAPYTEEDLANISAIEAKRVKIRGLFKIVGEEHLTTLRSREREKIRKQVIELCEQYHPRPLFVKLNTALNRTFLIDEKYYQDDANIIREVVSYSYNHRGEQLLKLIHSKSLELRQLLFSRYGLYMKDIVSLGRDKWKGREVLGEEITALIDKHERSLYSDIVSRFGFKHPYKIFAGTSSTADRAEAYTTTSEIPTRTQSNINTLLYDCIEEKGRFVQKGLHPNSIKSYKDYYRKVHPELIGRYSTSNIKFRPNEGMRFQ